MQKTFDSVHWDFLCDVLLGLHFSEQFVAWIMECVTTTYFSLVIYGGMHGHFRGARRLRQGDPSSPYLFGIYIEVLGRQLHQHINHPSFCCHPKCAKQWIAHLAYEDDLLLFARGDRPPISTLVACQLEFGEMAGLKANQMKSCIYMIGVDE